MSEANPGLPVLVIGAGPVGLAAAAHLVERGLPFLVLEAGDGPGAAVAEWGHIRMFSPPCAKNRAARSAGGRRKASAPPHDHATGLA